MSFDSVTSLRLLLVGGFPEGLIGGLALNIVVALIAFSSSFVIGHLLALGRLGRAGVLRCCCTAYIEVVRAVPLLIVLFWVFFSIPLLLRTTVAPLWSALIALTAYASAYQAEYIRSGIEAVAAGEIEAARSLGLRTPAVWLRVVLPQAHRRMLPTYASYFTSLFKDTSVLYLVGLVDLMQTGLIAAERHPGRMLQTYATVGALFFIVCFGASRLAGCIERRLARKPAPARAFPTIELIKAEPHAHAQPV